MYGLFAAFLPPRRAPLALGLCLLAILFALEAKTAWYGPAVGRGSDIRAAKALPAGLLKLVEHGVPAADPAHPSIAFVYLPASTAAWFAFTRIHSGDAILRHHLPFFSAAHFSPSAFFRPPPAI